MMEQEIALSETQSQVPETDQEPVPVGDGQAVEEDRIAQERELGEELGAEDENRTDCLLAPDKLK